MTYRIVDADPVLVSLQVSNHLDCVSAHIQSRESTARRRQPLPFTNAAKDDFACGIHDKNMEWGLVERENRPVGYPPEVIIRRSVSPRGIPVK